MKIKILPISTFLFLVACSIIPPVKTGKNALGIEDEEIALHIIDNTSLSIQQTKKGCIEDLLPECIVKAEGLLRIFPFDINDPLLTPNNITSKIGFKAARIDFSKSELSVNDLPSNFTFKELLIEILVQDGIVNEIPTSSQSIKLNMTLGESDLEELVFNRSSCNSKKVCNYTVEGPKTIINLKVTKSR